jgi:shikimate dehydrogenase/3-dehydroquinate dehydratase type I
MAIVVSHIDRDFDVLAARALRQAPLADLIELRLDRIGHPGEEALRRFVKSSPKPVIVTIHGAEAFGTFEGSIDERCEILHAAARAGAKFVDIDWTLSLDLGPMEGKCHRIVSRHDIEGTPEDLARFEEDVREVLHEGDAVKLVTHAAWAEDGMRMLRHLRTARGGLIAFSSGPRGAFTRILAPIFGSPFTYAAPADLGGEGVAEPTAPGQIRVNDLRATLPPVGATGETAVFAILGSPVGHSLSPRVQGMALKSAHLDAVFVPIEPRDFAAFLALADDPCFRGFSVTAPFKTDAWRLAAHADEPSQAVEASNTLVREDSGWHAHNTDCIAVGEVLERAFRVHGELPGRPVALPAARALVLGTGGAARAALGALARARAKAAVAGRRLEAAHALARHFGCAAIPWDEIAREPYDVLIHCTTHGSGGEAEPVIPEEWIHEGTLVLEAIYRPLRTALVAAAERRGCTVIPGAEWFVRQAREQFRLFTQKTPDEALMRLTFEHALGLRRQR